VEGGRERWREDFFGNDPLIVDTFHGPGERQCFWIFQKTIKGFFGSDEEGFFLMGFDLSRFLAPESVGDDLRIFRRNPILKLWGDGNHFLVGHLLE